MFPIFHRIRTFINILQFYPMNILFASPAVVEVYNGEYFNNSLATAIPRYLKYADHLTSVSFKRECTGSSVRLLNFPHTDFVFVEKVNTLKGLVRIWRKNRKILEENVRKADVCIVHIPSFAGENIARLAKKYGKPCLQVIIGCPWDAYRNYSMKGKIVAPFRYQALRRTISSAEYIIYVTNKFLQERYPTRGYALGCSDVELADVSPDVLNRRLEKIRNSVGRVMKLGTVAVVDVRYKGQEYVIRSLAELKKKGKRYEYHLAGGGDNAFLRTLSVKLGVEDQLVFHGMLSHEKVFDFLDEIDIYVHPSRLEGLPRALVEAMSRACPALGTAVGGIPELLDSDCLFRAGNVEEITVFLKRLDKGKMEQLAYRNFEKSKLYEREYLEHRRDEFIQNFLKHKLKT